MAHKLAGSLRGHPVIPAPGNSMGQASCLPPPQAAQPTRTLVIIPGDSPASSRPVHGLPENRPLFALPRRPPNSALSAIDPPPIPPVWRPWASSSALTVPRAKPKQAKHPHSSRENVCGREPPSAGTVALGKGSAKVAQMGVGEFRHFVQLGQQDITGDRTGTAFLG
ncbi:hypothetical protein BKA56DRAFT_676111 [Ilyonectria sp. MPI-CAGE-AT-0026]|nr:hypothetical protein BKA56DRAFT_676111 [Ilyonectria sp. MPI-CAGE-AT-0026]